MTRISKAGCQLKGVYSKLGQRKILIENSFIDGLGK